MMCGCKKSLISLSIFCITYTNFIANASDSLNFHQDDNSSYRSANNTRFVYTSQKKQAEKPTLLPSAFTTTYSSSPAILAIHLSKDLVNEYFANYYRNPAKAIGIAKSLEESLRDLFDENLRLKPLPGSISEKDKVYAIYSYGLVLSKLAQAEGRATEKERLARNSIAILSQFFAPNKRQLFLALDAVDQKRISIDYLIGLKNSNNIQKYKEMLYGFIFNPTWKDIFRSLSDAQRAYIMVDSASFLSRERRIFEAAKVLSGFLNTPEGNSAFRALGRSKARTMTNYYWSLVNLKERAAGFPRIPQSFFNYISIGCERKGYSVNGGLFVPPPFTPSAASQSTAAVVTSQPLQHSASVAFPSVSSVPTTHSVPLFVPKEPEVPITPSVASQSTAAVVTSRSLQHPDSVAFPSVSSVPTTHSIPLLVPKEPELPKYSKEEIVSTCFDFPDFMRRCHNPHALFGKDQIYDQAKKIVEMLTDYFDEESKALKLKEDNPFTPQERRLVTEEYKRAKAEIAEYEKQNPEVLQKKSLRPSLPLSGMMGLPPQMHQGFSFAASPSPLSAPWNASYEAAPIRSHLHAPETVSEPQQSTLQLQKPQPMPTEFSKTSYSYMQPPLLPLPTPPSYQLMSQYTKESPSSSVTTSYYHPYSVAPSGNYASFLPVSSVSSDSSIASGALASVSTPLSSSQIIPLVPVSDTSASTIPLVQTPSVSDEPTVDTTKSFDRSTYTPTPPYFESQLQQQYGLSEQGSYKSEQDSHKREESNKEDAYSDYGKSIMSATTSTPASETSESLLSTFSDPSFSSDRMSSFDSLPPLSDDFHGLTSLSPFPDFMNSPLLYDDILLGISIPSLEKKDDE